MCDCCGKHDHPVTIQVIKPQGADQAEGQAEQTTEKDSD